MLKAIFNIDNYEKIKLSNLCLIEKEYQNKIILEIMNIHERIIKIKNYMNFENKDIKYPISLYYDFMEGYKHFYNYMLKLMVEQFLYQELW